MTNLGGLFAATAASLIVCLIGRPAAAIALDKPAAQIKIDARLIDAQPLPVNASVAILDADGVVGNCTASKPGAFTCNTANMAAPLLIKAGDLFAIASTLTGNVNVNGLTDSLVNNVYQSWGTSADAQWSPGTPPLLITPAVLNSMNIMLDIQFEQALLAFKVKNPLAANVFTDKLNSKTGLGKLLTQLAYNGVGTAQERILTTLPGVGSLFAASRAIPANSGTLATWTVQSQHGTTYRSVYAMNPQSPRLSSVFQRVNDSLNNEMGILKHEGPLLDATNLSGLFASEFLKNGNDATTQTEIEATFLRGLKVKSLVPGSIGSFKEDFPSAGSDLIGINRLRTAISHGVTCIDYCCEYYLCGPGATPCFEYGNQRISSIDLEALGQTEIDSSGQVQSTRLRAGGLAPQGTVASYVIDDLKGLYNNTDIPLKMTRQIMVKPFHNGSSFPLFYDDFRLDTEFTPPVAPDDRFSFKIQPQTGTMQTFTAYPPASTTEQFKLSSPTSTDLSQFIGKAMKFKFSPPSTFVVHRQFARGVECTATDSKTLTTIPPVLSPTAKSVTFKTDKTLNGAAIIGARYSVSQRPLDGGPEIRLDYSVGSACN